MKLDYIENVNEVDEHVVRLYDFNKQEAILFRELILDIINDNVKINLGKVDFIEARNCNLILGLFGTDEGIFTKDHQIFFCALTKRTYMRMVDLLDPFCEEEKSTYQYLYDLDNPINFLFAPEGIW